MHSDKSLNILQCFPDCKNMLSALSANSFVLNAKKLLMTSFFEAAITRTAMNSSFARS